MSRPSALSTSLILSVLIIVTGIMMIIFIHFDRGLGYSREVTAYEQEQSQLIDHIYRNNALRNSTMRQSTETAAAPVTESILTPNNAPQAINPGYALPPLSQPQNPQTWGNSLDDELRNNPWDPYYRPASY